TVPPVRTAGLPEAVRAGWMPGRPAVGRSGTVRRPCHNATIAGASTNNKPGVPVSLSVLLRSAGAQPALAGQRTNADVQQHDQGQEDEGGCPGLSVPFWIGAGGIG